MQSLPSDRFLAYISLGSQRLQHHAQITQLHSLLLPLIMLLLFSQTSAVYKALY
ncbi:MAG: hypothetical protein V7L22_10400 [Nostoc sp.]